jgi:mono/diheme cytochrome c family protein
MRQNLKVLAALALMGAANMSIAQDMTDPGQATFQQYCATCHGAKADGTGPMTQMLTTAVPDLTGLSQRNDGVFPMLEVIHIVDGRTGLRGHGGPMPVYGAIFDDEATNAGPYGGPLYTRGKILSVAYYLENLQK